LKTEGVKSSLVTQIVHCYQIGGKVLIFGNGGLAAESEHFAAELMGKYARQMYIPCISLTTNSSLITALANDLGYENVFSHQVEFLGEPPYDLVIGMTTSCSANVLKGIEKAKERGMATCLLDRRNVDGISTEAVQENILKLLHTVAREVKEAIVGTGIN